MMMLSTFSTPVVYYCCLLVVKRMLTFQEIQSQCLSIPEHNSISGWMHFP